MGTPASTVMKLVTSNTAAGPAPAGTYVIGKDFPKVDVSELFQ